MRPRHWHHSRALGTVATIVAVGLIYALGVGLRWSICSTIETGTKPSGADELPYTLESALLFHYAETYQQTGRIPRLDERAQMPEGLRVGRELSVGKGLVAAWLYNGLGVRGMSFQRFVRRFDAAWYCLGVVPLFFLVRGRTRSGLAAAVASLPLALAYTAVVRSTGLEFSRENFALPLIFAHFWLFDTGLRTKRLAPSVVAAGLLAVALATWDLTQLYLLLVVAYCAVRCLVRRAWAVELVHLAPTIAAGLIAGLAVPYLWAHAFVVSYAMLLGYGLMAWWLIEMRAKLPAPATKAVLAAALVGTLVAASVMPAGKTYGHFRALFFAKLRHLTVKPKDPERLSYDARILWTPALHSATTRYGGRVPLSDFTPMFVLGALAGACIVAAKLVRRRVGAVSLPVTMVLAWLGLYVLFVRMHVFLIFFLAVLVGIAVGAVLETARSRWPLALAVPVVLIAVSADMGQRMLFGTVNERYRLYVPARDYDLYENLHYVKIVRWYGRSFPYAASAELVKWLKANTPDDAVVLAMFPLEPTIFVQAGRPIVLQPKFESAGMRDKVHGFLESFYARSERDLHAFCRRYGADYFVLEPGMFAGPDAEGWVYGPRYCAGAAERTLDEIGTSWMDRDPSKCGYFRFEIEIGAEGEFGYAYRVFSVIPEADIDEARANVALARDLFQRYMNHNEREDLDLAAQGLELAVELWPGNVEAWRLMVSVYVLLGDDDRAVEAKARWDMLDAQERGRP